MGCARQLSFGRARMFSRAAAILAVLFSQGICATRSGPAPAPGPAAFGVAAPLGTAAPASAPAKSPAASSASGTSCVSIIVFLYPMRVKPLCVDGVLDPAAGLLGEAFYITLMNVRVTMTAMSYDIKERIPLHDHDL